MFTKFCLTNWPNCFREFSHLDQSNQYQERFQRTANKLFMYCFQWCTDHRKHRLISRTSSYDPMIDSQTLWSILILQCLKYICLTLFFGCFFFCLHIDKNIAVLSQLVFFALIVTNIWQFCPSVFLTLSQYTYLDQSIIYLLPRIVHFISGVTHMENGLLFCSKLRPVF